MIKQEKDCTINNEIDINAINDIAIREGWCISETGITGDMFRLERHDEATIFKTDPEAWEYVKAMAKRGSKVHIDALSFFRDNAKEEYKNIISNGRASAGKL